MKVVNIAELQQKAKENIPSVAYDYIVGGSQDELTLNRNRSAFSKIKLKQRVLVDISNIDLGTMVLGETRKLPLLLSPVSMHKLSHPEGELATARAAARKEVIMALSSLSSTSMEEVAEASESIKWYQLYWMKDRSVTQKLVERAETSGYKAIILTVDTAVLGKREKDIHNNFSIPDDVSLENYGTLELQQFQSDKGSGLTEYVMAQFDNTITWKDLGWLKGLTNLPIILKGIQTSEDAKIALECGIAAIIVSNHGGRQLDGSLSSIECLPRVVKAVDGKIDVLIDSGIRRGSDIVKAIALGASGVMIGRAYIWGLGANGEDGVVNAIEILIDEVLEVMALIGCTSITELDSSFLEKETIPNYQ